MGKLMIVNGSPRAPKSNSKLYIQSFLSAWQGEAVQYQAVARRPEECFQQLTECSDLLLVFPLYTDGLPSVLMEFLQAMLARKDAFSLTVHVLINCGFQEPSQNDVAVDMIRLFCKRGGYTFGSCLRMRCGEAFPTTPLMALAKRKIRALAAAISRDTPRQLSVSMPLTRRMFLSAADRYWLKRGEANGLTRADMTVMQIEGPQTASKT